MEKQRFEQDMRYQAALAVARELLNKGVIDFDDYRTIETRLTEKYRPVFGAISQ